VVRGSKNESDQPHLSGRSERRGGKSGGRSTLDPRGRGPRRAQESQTGPRRERKWLHAKIGYIHKERLGKKGQKPDEKIRCGYAAARGRGRCRGEGEGGRDGLRKKKEGDHREREKKLVSD